MKAPKLLIKAEVDRQVSESWERVGQIPDEDNGRQDMVEKAIDSQHQLYKQLDLQDKVFPLLWNAIHTINPENPLQAALNLAANAERIRPVLKSYCETVTS